MKKIFALVVLVAILAVTTPAQVLCGIGHTDRTTGEFICDDPRSVAHAGGIGHTDAPTAPKTTADVITMALLDLIPVIVNVVGH